MWLNLDPWQRHATLRLVFALLIRVRHLTNVIVIRFKEQSRSDVGDDAAPRVSYPQDETPWLTTPSPTCESPNGSMMPYSVATRRIHRSDLIDMHLPGTGIAAGWLDPATRIGRRVAASERYVTIAGAPP
jgi:hypothetical protein